MGANGCGVAARLGRRGDGPGRPGGRWARAWWAAALASLLALAVPDATPLAHAGVPGAGWATRPDAALQAGCDPRPPVRLGVVPTSDTTLTVSVTAGQGTLSAVRFDRVAGASVEIAGRQPITSAQPSIALPAGTTTTTFVVRRPAPSAAATVELVVVDGCGEWKTFVGGGTDPWTAPTVTRLEPATGPTAGGTRVTLTGSGFSTAAGATAVKFGQAAASDVSCPSSTSCQATSPPGSGTVDVTVTVNGRTSPSGAASRFTYGVPATGTPTVTGVQPSTGSAAGNTQVTIVGTGFATGAGATVVKFGDGEARNVSCASATTCTLVTPAGAGPVDVAVTVAGRTSAAAPAARYFYTPTIATIEPNSGPVAGGTTVTIRGIGFLTAANQTLFLFNGLVGRDIACSSPTLCTAKTPPATAPGTYDVIAYAGSQYPSTPDAFSRFTFTGGRPAVTGISPSFGQLSGGTQVTITGSGFDTAPNATQVLFGDTPAAGVTCSSPTTCTTRTPPGAGVVDVRAIVGDNESVPGVASRYQYGASEPPAAQVASSSLVVATLSPSGGATSGGTLVKIEGSGFSVAPDETVVKFGAAGATTTSCPSTTVCYAVSPAGSGTVDVSMTVRGREATRTTVMRFTYVAPPTASQLILPARSGSSAGGDQFSINGSAFSTVPGVTRFWFNNVPATSVTCPTTTRCDVIAPPAPSQDQTTSVQIGVKVAGVAGSNTVPYLYLPVPRIASIGPSSGPAAGGSQVTISGANFTTNASAVRVYFGGKLATGVSCGSTTTCVATSPAGVNTVDVVIQVAGINSPVHAGTKFRYPRAVTSAPSVTTNTTSTLVGHVATSNLRVEWSGLETTGDDYAKLYRMGAPDSDSTKTLLIGSTEDAGSRETPAPLVPGTYEWRLFRNFQNGSGTMLAKSAPIEVRTPLVVTPSTPSVSSTVTVAWKGANGYVYQIVGREWLGLYEVGAPDGAFLTRLGNLSGAAVPAQVNVTLPNRAGTFEFRLYMDDAATTGRQTLIGRSVPFTVGAPPGATTTCGDQSQPGVYVFAERNYGGACARVLVNTPTFTGTLMEDNAVSSIKTVGGWRAVVNADANYGGAGYVFRADNSDFAAFGFDNVASSIRVFPTDCGDGTADGVYLYSEQFFVGACSRFTADDADLGDTAIDHDGASSVRIVGSGWTATLYEHPSFGGASQAFTASVQNLGATAFGHDRASSIKVVRAIPTGSSGGYRILGTASNCGDEKGEGVYLYTAKNFNKDASGAPLPGESCTMLDPWDNGDFTAVHTGSGARSIRVVSAARLTVRLFTEKDFGGTSASFIGEMPDITKTPLNTSPILSMQVIARRQWDDPANWGNDPARDTDWGFYWFRCGNCRYGKSPGETVDPLVGRPDGLKASPNGQNDDYFRPTRRTVIYAHGNQPAIGRSSRENPMLFGDDVTIPWKQAGGEWNFGIFYWNQFADEDQWLFGATDSGAAVPIHSEAKIWTADHELAKEMRMRKKDGSFSGRRVNVPIAELFVNDYVRFMTAVGDHPHEIRFVGHSLGGQLVTRAAWLIKRRLYDAADPRPPSYMMPGRVALIDPYMSDAMGFGGRPYLPLHTERFFQPGGQFVDIQVQTGVGYQMWEHVKELKAQRGTVFEYHHFSMVAPIHNLLASEMILVDTSATSWILNDPLKFGLSPLNPLTPSMASTVYAHQEAVYWYFASYQYEPPRMVCVSTGLFSCEWRADGGGITPTAKTPTDQIRTANAGCPGSNCSTWIHYEGANTRGLYDDKYAQQRR